MKTFQIELGKLIQERRISRGISQRRLGEYLGNEGKYAEHVIQRIEYGKYPVPLQYIRQLSEILGIPIDRFIP